MAQACHCRDDIAEIVIVSNITDLVRHTAAGWTHKEVVRLDITVDEASLVQELQERNHLDH